MLTNKYKAKRAEGFTIIEVLIVLAIAGLIIMIVLLAVPALNRQRDNTRRKNDASAVASTVSEFANNNNGALPTKTDGSEFKNNAKYSYYDSAKMSLGAGAAGATMTDTESVKVLTGVKCNGNSVVAGTTRNAIVLYAVANASSTGAQQCIDAQ